MSSEEEYELVAAIVAILAVHFIVHRQRQSRRCRRALTLPRAPYTYRDPDCLGSLSRFYIDNDTSCLENLGMRRAAFDKRSKV
ncbi:hypothetical protein FRX31_026918 [Thalictrum thalictroides]|uniref:Uncharacterized protein n=1 Tax=Thalictrum thalictroides TaxID=46969 RepID=A0A7J6VH18_THATH|nr:hypothetical protein FRX31_026918 [Thalictrum thalictroides]